MSSKQTVVRHGQGVPVRLLTIQNFADAIGISVWTARQYAYAGKIASVKIGKRLQVPATEVDRLIEQNMRPALQIK
jgi:excisionase family DNA binding protein